MKSQPLQSVKIARSSIGHNYHIYQPRFISVVWRFAFYQGSRTPYKRSHVSPLSRQRKWKCRWCCRSIGISDNPCPNHRGSERSKVQILAVARFKAKSVFHRFLLLTTLIPACESRDVFYIELTHKRCRVSPNMTSRQNNFHLGNIAENKRSPHTRMWGFLNIRAKLHLF